MLEIFRHLEASGEELIVTDHGSPALRIIPIKDKAGVDELFGAFQGHVAYHRALPGGNLTSTEAEWDGE